MQWQRAVLSVLLGLVAIDHVRFSSNLLDRYLHRERFGRAPFVLNDGVEPVVAYPLQEAADAGLKRGDRVLEVDGRTATISVVDEAFASLKPGQTVAVKAQTAAEAPRDLTIQVVTLRREADLLISVVLEAFVLLLCLPLGFGVAFLRPADIRSWVLLWMMLSFVPSFRLFEFYSHTPFYNLLNYFFVIFLRSSWPVCMMVLGLTFPDWLRLHGWWRVATVALSIAGGYCIFSAAILFGYFWTRSIAPHVAAQILPLRDLTGPSVIVGMILIGFYFAIIGFRSGIAKTKEDRRRVVLLQVGSHIAFLPIFILVVRAMIRHRDTFDGVPVWISVPTIFLLLLFPLTLAYLVLVHRALDIRMVLRSGLQYALAKRAVNVVRILLIVGASVSIPRLMQATERRVEQLLLIPVIMIVVILGNRLASRAREWMDRRFFREEYHAEQILSELSTEMRRMLDPASLVETVSRRIAESLHVTHLATMLRNHAAFTPAFVYGYETPVEAAFPIGDPVARRLELVKAPQRIYLEDENSWVNRELRGHPDRERLAILQSQLLLPIEGQGTLAGFISLGPKRSEEPYTRGDVQLLQSVVAQAGLALENTRLSTAMAHEMAQKERVSQEMEIARNVQERLFPQKRPVIEGIAYAGECRPAQSVGGDSYDFLEVSGGRFCFSIGDVSGKGVPASILMAVVQTSIRSNAMIFTGDLGILMNNVNLLVDEASPKRHFATLFFGQYDLSTRVLRYVNAAHNPPLLLRAGAEPVWLRPTGQAIGWSKRAKFQESSIELSAGDLLLLYTDGITEAMNPQKEEFGEERLLQTAQRVDTLHPDAIIPAMLHAVDVFAAGEPQHDDMTLVVLKVH